MVLLIGARYNPGIHERLRKANRAKSKLLSQDSPVRAGRSLRRRKQGRVQEMVLAVLLESGKPLSIGQIHGLVEERLGGSVSRDTVCSCLTVGVRQGGSGFRRIGVGVYEAESL